MCEDAYVTFSNFEENVSCIYKNYRYIYMFIDALNVSLTNGSEKVGAHVHCILSQLKYSKECELN